MSHATETTSIAAARKPHVCDWCGTRIDAGQPYERWRWYDGGDGTTVRAHPECLEAAEDPALEGEDVFFCRDQPRGCNCGHDPRCEWCAALKEKKE